MEKGITCCAILRAIQSRTLKKQTNKQNKQTNKQTIRLGTTQTRIYQATKYQKMIPTICRLCNNGEESINHLLLSCKTLTKERKEIQSIIINKTKIKNKHSITLGMILGEVIPEIKLNKRTSKKIIRKLTKITDKMQKLLVP